MGSSGCSASGTCSRQRGECSHPPLRGLLQISPQHKRGGSAQPPARCSIREVPAVTAAAEPGLGALLAEGTEPHATSSRAHALQPTPLLACNRPTSQVSATPRSTVQTHHIPTDASCILRPAKGTRSSNPSPASSPSLGGSPNPFPARGAAERGLALAEVIFFYPKAPFSVRAWGLPQLRPGHASGGAERAPTGADATAEAALEPPGKSSQEKLHPLSFSQTNVADLLPALEVTTRAGGFWPLCYQHSITGCCSTPQRQPLSTDSSQSEEQVSFHHKKSEAQVNTRVG